MNIGDKVKLIDKNNLIASDDDIYFSFVYSIVKVYDDNFVDIKRKDCDYSIFVHTRRLQLVEEDK